MKTTETDMKPTETDIEPTKTDRGLRAASPLSHFIQYPACRALHHAASPNTPAVLRENAPIRAARNDDLLNYIGISPKKISNPSIFAPEGAAPRGRIRHNSTAFKMNAKMPRLVQPPPTS
jgi:hypothetical protein